MKYNEKKNTVTTLQINATTNYSQVLLWFICDVLRASFSSSFLVKFLKRKKASCKSPETFTKNNAMADSLRQ